MIYQEPPLTEDDSAVIGLIETLRKSLRLFTLGQPRRWMGSLRRLSIAKAIQGSNSIEGIYASIDESVAAVDNEPPLDPRSERMMAVIGYQKAMTYLMQSAKDPEFILSKQFFKSLHFMMTDYSMANNPGQFRPGSIFVVDDKTGKIVYEAPDREIVDGLIDELVDYLQGDSADGDYGRAMIRGAMAHLNLAMIHPFSDGNGRMARVTQTLVLAQESGVVDPIFASIEEWLGDNTQAYYDVLTKTGHGKWNPRRDAAEWIRFCLCAHFKAAMKVKRRHEEYRRLFEEIETLAKTHRLPSRAIMPTFDAALGLTLTNERYIGQTDAQPRTATRDLRLLVEKGLLVAVGEKRGRVYRRSEVLANLRAQTRFEGVIPDPYEVVAKMGEGERLPGL